MGRDVSCPEEAPVPDSGLPFFCFDFVRFVFASHTCHNAVDGPLAGVRVLHCDFLSDHQRGESGLRPLLADVAVDGALPGLDRGLRVISLRQCGQVSANDPAQEHFGGGVAVRARRGPPLLQRFHEILSSVVALVDEVFHAFDRGFCEPVGLRVVWA